MTGTVLIHVRAELGRWMRTRSETARLLAAQAWPATLLLSGLIVLLARWGPDWPAQQFRASVARDAGLVAFSDQWYAGLVLPGYSVLYPVVARVVGAAVTGWLAATTAAWCAGRLLRSADSAAYRRYSIAMAFTLAASVLIGQVPFLLGAAFGSAALLALVRRRHRLTVLLAAACSLSSPLAGAFLLLIALALVGQVGWRRAAALTSALSGLATAAIVGGAGGPFPCPWPSLAGVLGFGLAAFVMTSPQDRLVRHFALIYAAAGILAFAIPNPIGGNITRLGKLIALPLACYLLTGERRRRQFKAALCALAALSWTVVPVSTAIAHGATDPSRDAPYYEGLLSFLKTQNPATGRLEIPFTREHWETAWVASAFPLARGWERQTDLRYNAVLYRPLTPGRYKRWLDSLAVSLVALPNVQADYGGQAEAQLLKHPPTYLKPIWHNENWQVWKVLGAHPLVLGPATISHLTTASFTVEFARPGTAQIRIRASNLWQITAGTGCLQRTPDGWLRVSSSTSGTVSVSARLNMHLLIDRDNDCDPG